MAAPTKVTIKITATDPNILAVICTTYRKVEVTTGGKTKVKYRKFHSVTKAAAVNTFDDLKHPGKGGLLSVIGIDANTQLVFSSLRRLKK